MSQNKDASKKESPPWEAMSKKGNKNKRRHFLFIVFILLLVGLIVNGFRAKPVEVELATVDRGLVKVEVVEEGKTRIKNRYVISSPFLGEMERIALKPGHLVKAGETKITAITPNPSVLLDSRTKAQALARVEMSKASKQRAMEHLEIARTAERFAQSNLARLNKIKSTGSVSETDFENAEREALIRAREVIAANAAIKVSEYELEQAKAAAFEFDDASGAAKVAKVVTSPVTGVVLQVYQESERAVTMGMPLLEVGDPKNLEIEAEILSKDAVAMKVGDLVTVEQWGGEEALEARVRLVEPAAFMKVSALGVEEQRVWVIMDILSPIEKRENLKDRYRVEVRVATWQEDDALRVPSGAPFRMGNQWKVFVLQRDVGILRDVRMGHNDGRYAEILEGLEVGEKVMVHPPDVLKDGMRVIERKK